MRITAGDVTINSINGGCRLTRESEVDAGQRPKTHCCSTLRMHLSAYQRSKAGCQMGKIYIENNEYLADEKGYIVTSEYLADEKVYIVSNEYLADKKVCIVNNEYLADKKLFIVDNEYLAD